MAVLLRPNLEIPSLTFGQSDFSAVSECLSDQASTPFHVLFTASSHHSAGRLRAKSPELTAHSFRGGLG